MTKRTGHLLRRKYNEYLISTIAMSASLYLAAIVDNIMVGNILGTDALSAVNLTTPIVYIAADILLYSQTTDSTFYKGQP